VIKVSVLYANKPGAKFDMDYYCNTHIRLVEQKLRPALKRVEVEQGVAGGAPDTPPTYVAMGHLIFDSVAAFEKAFNPNADAIVNDIPNYTNIEPVIQISEIKMD
jgi:uncharacterized protein (TIGR02118 family)